MARSNPKPTKTDGQVKAGKKKSYKAPPPVNRVKQDARLLGEQQFWSKENFTEEIFEIKMRDGVLVHSVKHVSIPYRYDPTRKRLVFNTFFNHSKVDDANPRRKPSKNKKEVS